MKNRNGMKFVKRVMCAAAVLTGLAYAQEAMPEQGGGPPPQAQPVAPQPEVEDAQIEQAVSAYLLVNQIQTRVQQELEGVDDQTVVQGIVSQARVDMVEAVKEAGMEPEAYEQVMKLVTEHEGIRARFLQELQEQQAKS